jgi:hypothetical protein
MDTGKFVISLDFELMWGVRDILTRKYGDAIIGTRIALEQILSSFEKHCIKATLPPLVLFHKNKKLIRKCQL